MSDFIPPEVVEAAKHRDARFRDLDLSIEVETQLRESRPLFLLMSKLREDADAAMQEFVNVNCADTKAIQGLQSRVFCFRYAIETFEAILTRGRTAQRSIESEDQIERERFDGA